MAIYYAAKLYDKTWTYLWPAINSTTTEFTVQDILNSNLCVTNNITAIAASIWGTALSPSNSVKTGKSEGSYIADDDMYKSYRFYDVTPTPITIHLHNTRIRR